MSLKILVVEDEAPVRNLIQNILLREGHKVVTASNGVEALAQLDHGFDLMLLDLSLPHLNGQVLCLANQSGDYQVPIIVVTGEVNTTLKEIGAEYIFTILRKPLAFAVLASTVRAVESYLAQSAEVNDLVAESSLALLTSISFPS